MVLIICLDSQENLFESIVYFFNVKKREELKSQVLGPRTTFLWPLF